MPGVCKRRATQPIGMHRRPGWHLYSFTDPKLSTKTRRRIPHSGISCLRAFVAAVAARGESLAAFDGRCILDPPQRGYRVGDPGAGCVAPRSNIPDILGRPHPNALENARRGPRGRALPSRRLARLGATPDFHHGLLEMTRASTSRGSHREATGRLCRRPA